MVGIKKEMESLALSKLKKMNKKSLLILPFLIFVSHRVYSFESKDLNCVRDSQKEMVLIFANGMFTDEDSADNSHEELKRKNCQILVVVWHKVWKFLVEGMKSVSGTRPLSKMSLLRQFF